MYLIRLAILQLRSNPGSSLFSLMLFGIGMAMISFLFLARQKLDEQINLNLAGIDLVAGAKGSPVQIILSSVMHMDYPTGNISLTEAAMISNHPLVRQTIPIALGDNHMGYRIIGTSPELVGIYRGNIRQGSMFDKVMDATIGSAVARATQLSIGDTFTGVHGFQTHGHAHDDFHYTVTGVLKPTGTVLDNLILTPVESVWKVHDHEHDQEHEHTNGHQHQHDHANSHDHEHHHHDTDNQPPHDHGDHEHRAAGEHHHDHGDHGHPHIADDEASLLTSIREKIESGEDISAAEMEVYLSSAGRTHSQDDLQDEREITALLIFYRSPAAAVQLPRLINETTNMQAASPAIEVNRLLTMLGYGFHTIRLLAWIIILISAIHILVHLISTLNQGLFQLALMRVMGSSSLKVFAMILSQGVMLAFGGWLVGMVVSRLIWVSLPLAGMLPGSMIPGLQLADAWLMAYALAVGVMASVYPAWKAYRSDIHYILRKTAHA